MTQITAQEQMIDAAEELVAEGGIAAMTLRQVHARAGQSNKVAAQYHFGSKSGLIAAVVERRMSIINEHRRVILSRIGSAGRVVASRELIEALIMPFVQETVMRENSYYARFLVQCTNDPLFVDMTYEKSHADTVREVMDRLVERSPLPVETARNRAMNMAHLIAVAVARIEGSSTEIDDLSARITDLVDSCVGLFEAPTTLVDL
ncbi:TetR/AcrR family transcriptional regulator [Rhodococcus sp. NPDC019627]|uniref:TetR/AcrR family transcriptional regulator n=1 Tax=unclassified Rhodococcus (in: high G+C Gram-positive bacteria) TaxID=192944 RepID=UPI0033F243F1